MSKQQFLAENIKEGEIYVGLILGKKGQPDHHLILLTAKTEPLKWTAAQSWATSVGGDLPSRNEQSLLIANCKEEFEPRWYWSNEQNAHNSDYAWLQHFDDGNQSNALKSNEFRARAVRRIYIEELK